MVRKICVLFIIIISIFQLFAYDFEVDGIYYNIIDTNKVEVTYKTTEHKSYYGEINVPEKVPYQGIEYMVTGIGNAAFASCSGLTSITILKSITRISKFAFVLCDHLTSIIIPDSVKCIEEATFAGCRALAHIVLPESVTSIENVAFFQCANLAYIEIPKNITDLNSCAIFAGCEKLKCIKVLSTTPPEIHPLTGTDLDLSNCTLIVPKGAKAKYENASVWKDFGTIKENKEN